MIINLIGLCGSGKTTLAKKLSKHYKIPVLAIDEYRKITYKFYKNKELKGVYDKELYAENMAWLRMFIEASQLDWDNYIICTAGFNQRLKFLIAASIGFVINIKLLCNLKELKKRIDYKKKKTTKWWAYGDMSYEDFNKLYNEAVNQMYANIVIRTDRNNIEQTFKIAVSKIDEYVKYGV